MPSPPPPTDWNYRPRHVPSFVLGLVLALTGGLIAVEIVARLLAASGTIERWVPPAGRVVSLAQVGDCLHAARSIPGPKVLFLTDSVGGESALLENGYRDTRRLSLTSRLTDLARERGATVVPLTADGLLLPDLAALVNVASKDKFDAVLILLNARMFASEFEKGEKAFSRVFLLPALPGPLQRTAEGTCPSSGSPSVRFEASLHRHWVTFRVTQYLKTLWFNPTPKDAWTRLAKRLTGIPPGPRKRGDLEEAALQWKVVPYYPTGEWRGLPLEGLRSVIESARSAQIPLYMVFTPQNMEFLGSSFDAPWLKRNLTRLGRDLRAKKPSVLIYEDWSSRFQPDLFLDHCHLTPEGNERLARDLAALVAGVKP